MKLNKTQIKTIHKRCLSLIKRKEPSFFIFRKLRGAMGYMLWEDEKNEEKIEIDYRKSLLPTVIHECIHYLYPEWNETEVLYAESRVVNHLDSFEMAKILKLFSEKLYKNEKSIRVKKKIAKKRHKKNCNL
jgi:hypothetical protein